MSVSFACFFVGISFSITGFIIELILRRRNNRSRVVPTQPYPAAARPVAEKSTPAPPGQNGALRRCINNEKVAKIQAFPIRPVIRPAVVNNLPRVKDSHQVPVVIASNQPAATIPYRINAEAATVVVRD